MFAALLLLLVLGSPALTAGQRAAYIAPKEGALVGAAIDFGAYNFDLAVYEKRLKRQPAAYIVFLGFPFRDWELALFKPILNQIARRKAIAIVTLEPFDGLQAAQDPAALDALAARVAAWEKRGVTVVVRFAHEANGSWYPWCQKPNEYKDTFALVAEAVRRRTCKATMLWAPNEGGGYPFIGGQYQLQCTAADFAVVGSDCNLLDTNSDGQITMDDDMYTPYYPGDDAVDWVGLSVYHFGGSWPWGANVMPEDHKFADKITGNYVGAGGDQSGVPNFYDLFCNVRKKPMIIGETSALFNLCNNKPNGRGCGDGTSDAAELPMKRKWWRQVFSTNDTDVGPGIAKNFPMIKLINWFDIRKNENEAEGNTVDWTISTNSTVRNAWLKYVSQPWPTVNSETTYWKFRSAFVASQNSTCPPAGVRAHRSRSVPI